MEPKIHLLGTSQGGQADPPARSGSEDGRGGEAAPRLDNRTHFDREQGRWRIVLRDYGNGLCEVGWSFVATTVTGKAGRGESDERDVHEMRAVRRARSRLRQLVLSANANHLVTLTYRANVTDYRQTTGDLSRFVRRIKAELPNWVYIAVPERQQRGAWHWHMAVIGRQDVALLRACWRATVGEGNIDVQRPKRGSGNRRLGIVRYLSKYLAKGFEDRDRELNGRRFRASHGIQVPAEAIKLPREMRSDVRRFVLDRLGAHAGSVGYVWVDQSGLAGWACSWK